MQWKQSWNWSGRGSGSGSVVGESQRVEDQGRKKEDINKWKMCRVGPLWIIVDSSGAVKQRDECRFAKPMGDAWAMNRCVIYRILFDQKQEWMGLDRERNMECDGPVKKGIDGSDNNGKWMDREYNAGTNDCRGRENSFTIPNMDSKVLSSQDSTIQNHQRRPNKRKEGKEEKNKQDENSPDGWYYMPPVANRYFCTCPLQTWGDPKLDP